MNKRLWALPLVCLLALGLITLVLFATGPAQASVTQVDEPHQDVPPTPTTPEQEINIVELLHGIQTREPRSPTAGGDWDGFGINNPRVITDTGGYRMWYNGRNPANPGYGWATGMANSLNGLAWSKSGSNPVFTVGASGEWDDMYRGQSAFLKDAGIYKMWFSGGSSTGPWQTGYAASIDGITWSFYPGNPVLAAGSSGSWDEVEADGPSVILDGGTYKMWYFGCDSGYSSCNIGYATSANGISWVKHSGNPVLLAGTTGEWDEQYILWPQVVKVGSEYWMWYRSVEGQLGFATSPDGVSWTKYPANPVIGEGWDGVGVGGYNVLMEGGIYKMWLLSGVGEGDGIGYAESLDGIIWDMYEFNPILRPGDPGIVAQANYAHDWVNADTAPGTVVTVTLADGGGAVKAMVSGTANEWGSFESWQWPWNPEQPDLLPGDRITAEVSTATTTIDPVGEILGSVDADTDTVMGNISAPWLAPETLTVLCEVWVENGPPGIQVFGVDPNGGDYFCDFGSQGWDITPEQDIAVRYFEPDGNSVINIFSAPWMRVNYGHDWVGGNYPAGHTIWITVTDSMDALKATAQAFSTEGGGWSTEGFETVPDDWDPSQPDIQPGDWVEIASDDGYHNLIQVGELVVAVDVNTDIVSGNLFAPWFDPETLKVLCEVWVEMGPPGIEVSDVPPDGGGFSCNFGSEGWDIQSGQDIAVHYVEPDGDHVIGVFGPPWVRVNYGHDWVGGNYPAGHTITVTVEDSSFETKAEAVVQSLPGMGWGTDGFDTTDEDWLPIHPDITPGDWVHIATDDGYSNSIHVGEITGDVDVDTDSVSGLVFADWFFEELMVECHPWGGPPDAPGKSSSAEPDGSSPYFCQWDPGSEWDLLAGQDVGVMYIEPDGDRVINSVHAPAPYLSVDTWSDGNPAEGGNMDFYIQYRNEGDAIAENTLITATLEGMRYLMDTTPVAVMTGTIPGGEYVVWDFGSLPPGGTDITFQLYTQVMVPVSSTITNTVQIDTSTVYADWDANSKQRSWSAHVGPNDTHLNVGKQAWTGDPTPGGDLVWAVNTCNFGSTSSTAVTVTDTLPISTTLQYWWGQHPGWYELFSDPSNLRVQRPSISAGQCSEVYLMVHVDEDAPIGTNLVNTAEISASNDLETEDNFTANEVWVSPPHTNLEVHKNWNWGELVPGGEIRYNIEYRNSGNLPVVDTLYITETLPANTTYNSAWHYDDTGAQLILPIEVTSEHIVFQIDGLENGFSDNFEVVLNIDGTAEPGTLLVNHAEITSLPNEDRYDDNSSEWVEMVHEHGPNLRVRKEGDWHGYGEGHNAWFNIIFENVGDVGVEHATFTDTLPASMTLDGDPGTDWSQVEDFTWNEAEGWFSITFLDAHPNFRRDIYINTLIPGSDPLPYGLIFTNTAEAMLIPEDTDPEDNLGFANLGTGPDLYVEKRLVDGELLPGEVITFSLRFGNSQSGNAWWWRLQGNATLTDTLPSELEFIDSQQRFCGWSNWCTATPEMDNNLLTWPLWPINPGEWNEFYVTARITDTADGRDVLTNWARIASDLPGVDIDLNEDDNSTSVDWEIALPNFDVSKEYESNMVAGLPVTYTLTVENSGHETGTNLTLIDWLPDWMTYGGGGTYDAGLITWDIPSLPAGSTTEREFFGTLACEAGGLVNNQFYRISESDQGVVSDYGPPVSFSILAPTIEAGFDASSTVVYIGDTVNFTNTSTTDGTALSTFWDFDDGATDTGEDVAHIYTQSGVYTVTLTATDGCGFSDEFSVEITVKQRVFIPVIWR